MGASVGKDWVGVKLGVMVGVLVGVGATLMQADNNRANAVDSPTCTENGFTFSGKVRDSFRRRICFIPSEPRASKLLA